MDKLKLCPFCGGEAKPVPRFCMGYSGDGVICSVCHAETPKHLEYAAARRWWNTRAEPAPKTCKDCKWWVDFRDRHRDHVVDGGCNQPRGSRR